MVFICRLKGASGAVTVQNATVMINCFFGQTGLGIFFLKVFGGMVEGICRVLKLFFFFAYCPGLLRYGLVLSAAQWQVVTEICDPPFDNGWV